VLQQPIEFGQYVLVEEVGVGGMARVYRAVRSGPMGFRKEVAIKQILPQAAKDKKQIKALINEARLGGFLHHRNIVEVFEFNQVDDLYYIAMEYVDGYTLEQVLRRIPVRGKLPPRIALAIAIQLCQGLGYAHSAEDDGGMPMNLVHRDLKPGNVMVDRRGVVKIMDFGVARAETNLFTTQTVGMTKGTPAYMSPEQTTGGTQDPLDRRSDLFSAGSLIAEIVTGEVSFHATKLYEVLRKIADGETAPALKRIKEQLPVMEPVLRRALEPRPGDRYPDAETMGADIQAVYDELPGDEELGPWLEAFMEGIGPEMPALPGSEIEIRPLPGAPELSLDEEEDDDEPPRRGFRWGILAAVAAPLIALAVLAGVGFGAIAIYKTTLPDTLYSVVEAGPDTGEVVPDPADPSDVDPTPIEVEDAAADEATDEVTEAAEDNTGVEDSSGEASATQAPAIVVASSPSRAEVYLEGRRIGRTAYRYEQGTPGQRYRYTVTKTGYQDAVVTGVFPSDGAITITAYLPRAEEVAEAVTEPATPEPSSIAGDLPSAVEVVTPSTVEFIVGSNAAVRDCFAQAAANGDALPGRVWVRFSVAPSGRVSGARIITDGFAGSSLETCVSGRVDGLEFPPFAGSASKTAKYAFVTQ